jgi:hypothetical protein
MTTVKPPSFYVDHDELLSYDYQWNSSSVLSSTTTTSDDQRTVVFGLAFYQNYLVGCLNSGDICIWKMPNNCNDMTLTCTDKEDDPFPTVVVQSRPIVRLPVASHHQHHHHRALYQLRVVPRGNDKTWIVVSGDDGVHIIDWETEIVPRLQEASSSTFHYSTRPGTTLLPKKDLVQPCMTFRPHPSIIPTEINDFVVTQNALYAAAGDAFGCYKFDLETQTLVTTYNHLGRKSTTTKQKNHHPTTIITPMYTVALTDHDQMLLLGGESGQLAMVETRTDYGCWNDPNLVVPNASWISSVVVRDAHWWNVAGGGSSSSSSSSSSNSGGGGSVSTLHGPTRSIVTTISTRETPQAILARCNRQPSLISVANEHFVTHWKNPIAFVSSPPPQRVWCHPPSAYAIAVAPDTEEDDWIAVGGVGSIVDVFRSTQIAMQFSTS